MPKKTTKKIIPETGTQKTEQADAAKRRAAPESKTAKKPAPALKKAEKKPKKAPAVKPTEATPKPAEPVKTAAAVKPSAKAPSAGAITRPRAAAKPKEAPAKKTVKKPAVPSPAPEPIPPVTSVPVQPAPFAPAARPAPPVQFKKIQINERSTIRELSDKISRPASELLKKLLSMGTMATINQRIDKDVASLLLHEFGYEIEFVSIFREEAAEPAEDASKLKPRAPIVTVMGHVDHGKTSLLDAIRKTKVTEGEFGGITQHIGAYKVKLPKGEIVFLDTPGHEAFTAMRAHGAKVTDIVILVVAADDGVMPQTVEAIDHARVAGVPIIVAINKIDIPKSNPQNIKQQLSQYGLIAEDWGGDTMMVEISARNNINIDKLLEAVLFKAELLELKANPDRPGRGIIIEARMDRRKGPFATVLLQAGIIKIGDVFVSGLTMGKVRALIDDNGTRLLSAGPSTPVGILGFSSLPATGDKFAVVKDERLARDIISKRQDIFREGRLIQRKRVTLADLGGGKIKELALILKTDVLGSLEAVRDSLERFEMKDIKLRIIHSGAGAINESDVNLAITSNALIIGFNVRPDPNAETLAKREGVDIRIYKIIFELISDIKKALEGMLEPTIVETVVGRAEIKKIISVSKVGNIAGCLVIDGKAVRNAGARLIRDTSVIYEGKIDSLKRFKEDAKEVEKGYECGIVLENYNDIKTGDIIEFYVKEKVPAVSNASI